MMIKQLLYIVLTTPDRAWAPLPLRLVVGVIFMAHGSQKLFGAFGGPGWHTTIEMFGKMGLTPGWLWGTLAGCGEFFGGLSVLLGLVTRMGALNIAVVMAVAILHVHWGKFFADKGGFEYPLALLGAALSLLIAGGGRFSCDAVLQRPLAPKQESTDPQGNGPSPRETV